MTNEAMVAYLNDQKAKGFVVPDELLAAAGEHKGAAEPEKKQPVNDNRVEILADMWSQFSDISNEYFRLHGSPLPANATFRAISQEAADARMPVGAYMEGKYKLAAKREESAKLAYEKEVETRVKSRLEEERRKTAEETGSNPNLRTGESSRNSFVPKMKRDDFEKANGYQPERTRRQRRRPRLRYPNSSHPAHCLR